MHVKSGEHDNTQDGGGRSKSMSSGALITDLRVYWTRERLIRNAVRSLARLDDRTLRNIGVLHRDMIEFTIRYCLEC
jgi:hypothetical protein